MMETPELKPGYLVVLNNTGICLVTCIGDGNYLELVDDMGHCETDSETGIVFGGNDPYSIKEVYGFAEYGHQRMSKYNRKRIWVKEEPEMSDDIYERLLKGLGEYDAEMQFRSQAQKRRS